MKSNMSLGDHITQLYYTVDVFCSNKDGYTVKWRTLVDDYNDSHSRHKLLRVPTSYIMIGVILCNENNDDNHNSRYQIKNNLPNYCELKVLKFIKDK